MDSYDVAVIGGGAAGTAAALAAARAGARVVALSRGPGATALAAGGWHDAPPDPFGAALAAAGLDLTACAAPLPHVDGHIVRCDVTPPTHADAALSASAPPTLVCGIAGLPAFHASALCALWADAAALSPDALRAATLDLDGTPAAGWSPVSLAALIERDAERIIGPLRRVLERESAERVILPPILGLLDGAATRAAIARVLGVTVAEAIGGIPSVPGWRLSHALRETLAAAGVASVRGQVTARDLSDRAVRLRVVERERTTDIEARAAVLATGKYLGGGITAGIEFEEPSLGCDVAFRRFTRTIDDPAAALILTDSERSEPQLVLAAGVRVDGHSRPLDPSGAVFCAAVFVAGAVRAGVETAGLGLGAAAADGWTAGERAAAHAAS